MKKSSLEKSHSKFSNFKLTLISIILTISISLIWAVLALKTKIDGSLYYVLLVVFCFTALLNILLFERFKR